MVCPGWRQLIRRVSGRTTRPVALHKCRPVGRSFWHDRSNKIGGGHAIPHHGCPSGNASCSSRYPGLRAARLPGAIDGCPVGAFGSVRGGKDGGRRCPGRGAGNVLRWISCLEGSSSRPRSADGAMPNGSRRSGTPAGARMMHAITGGSLRFTTGYHRSPLRGARKHRSGRPPGVASLKGPLRPLQGRTCPYPCPASAFFQHELPVRVQLGAEPVEFGLHFFHFLRTEAMLRHGEGLAVAA